MGEKRRWKGERDATELQAAMVAKTSTLLTRGEASRRRCTSEATAVKKVVRGK